MARRDKALEALTPADLEMKLRILTEKKNGISNMIQNLRVGIDQLDKEFMPIFNEAERVERELALRSGKVKFLRFGQSAIAPKKKTKEQEVSSSLRKLLDGMSHEDLIKLLAKTPK